MTINEQIATTQVQALLNVIRREFGGTRTAQALFLDVACQALKSASIAALAGSPEWHIITAADRAAEGVKSVIEREAERA